MYSQVKLNKQQFSGSYYRIFIDQAPHAIAMFDRGIRYIGASRKWRSDYGLGHRPLQGISHYEIFPEIGEDWKKIHQDCLQGAVNTCEEAYFLRKDGSEQWITWDVRPWYDDAGNIGGILMFTNDITDRKKAEQRIQNLLEITQNQNKRLQNFADIVSHNLRTHSGNIESILALFAEEYPDLQREELVQMLHNASDNLSTTIEHLNESTSIHAKANKKRSQINLTDAFGKALEVIRSQAREESVNIVNELPHDLLVWGGPAYLESICLNLLTNAIRYSSSDRKREIRIEGQSDAVHTWFSVADNGIGIDLERHGNALFGLYKTFHDHPDSTGVGLFITRNQVEAMAGSITVDSKVGVGTTFRVTLPKQCVNE
jgi:PAS domain S-box-containing protein